MTEAFTNTRPVISVNGEENPQINGMLGDMIVNLPLMGSAHAELSLTNWGEGTQAADVLFSALDFGDSIKIAIAGRDPGSGETTEHPIFDGEITGIEERYGGGAPQLFLLVQDKLHHLGRLRNSRTFEEYTADEIVQAIARESGLTADEVSVSSLRSTYHQINESNLAFLFRLLTHFDVALRLDDGRLRARAEAPDSQPIVLNADQNKIPIRLLADLNNQQTTARVQGFNVGTHEQVSGSADTLYPSPAGTTAAQTLRRLGWSGDTELRQPFPLSQGEAEAYATAHFSSRARRFITGDIRCDGEPLLKSGREIRLEGVSPRLQGKYQVVHCVHRFGGEKGFETHIKVNRSDWGESRQ